MNEVTRPNLAVTAASRAGSPQYLTGFGNGFETEALPGALPVGRNSPQKCPYGLYAEQLSGSPFTAPRKTTSAAGSIASSRPSPIGATFRKADIGFWRTAPALEDGAADRAAALGSDPDPEAKPLLRRRRAYASRRRATRETSSGMGAHVYLVTRSMQDEYFYNADGEMLIVPQQGELRFWTEFGIIDVAPGEIAVIPRGVKMRVELHGRPGARLYLRELRRRLHPARARPDRRQLPRQSARFPYAGRGLRGPRSAGQAVRQMGRRAVAWPTLRARRWTSWPGTATTRPTNTTCEASLPSARSFTITPTPASSPC